MKQGDLLQVRHRRSRDHSWGPARFLGILLEPPQFPTYGNYPKKYTVLTRSGVCTTFTDRDRYEIEVIDEAR